MKKKLDLSKLSPAEQQEITLLIAENERLAEENLKLQTESLLNEERIKELNEEIDELTKDLIKEKHLIAKYNLERYVSKADLPKRKGEFNAKRTNGLPSTITQEKQKPGRKKGSVNFGEDFLAQRSLETEPITLDIAERLKSDNPDIIL